MINILTKGAMDLVGGAFFIEPNPVKAAKIMAEYIEKKRKALGI